MSLLTNARPRYLNDNAAPLSGGKLYFYEVGSTSTPKDTYSDDAFTIPNTNPVILSMGGLQPTVYLSGSYYVVLTDQDGVQMWEQDNVGGGLSAYLDVVQIWTRAQTFGQVNLLSFGNNVLWDSDTAQVAQHTLTENTTLGAPAHLTAGRYLSINVVQSASSGPFTFAFNAVFKGQMPVMPTDASHQILYVFYSPDGTNCHYTGGTGEIAN